jgi:hypothetical protein
VTNKKKPAVFMVFKEMLDLPDGRNRADLLNDPATPTETKDQLRRELHHAVEVVQSEADRNTQSERWAAENTLRDEVMSDYAPGKRGEPKRLLAKAVALTGRPDFPLRTVRGWIEDSRKPAKSRPGPVATTWHAVIEGEMLSQQKRNAGRTPKKSKG